MITINNLYYYYPRQGGRESKYYYIINDVPYYARTLERMNESLENIYDENNRFDPFVIDSSASEILLVSSVQVDIPYQQLSNGRFIELTGRVPFQDSEFIDETVLLVPLPDGQEINGVFQELPLNPIDHEILERIFTNYVGQTLDNASYDDILELINEPPFPASNFEEEPTIQQLEDLGRAFIERILLSREGGVLRRALERRVEAIEREIEDIRNPPVPSNVYIYNVNPRVDRDEIFELFADFGFVLDVDLIDGGYIVSFEEERDANSALSLNGRELDGNVIRVTRQPIEETVIQQSPPDNLTKESHAMYMSQVYGLPVILPQFLIINGLQVNFISFQEVGQMLSQIERYILDPVLQPWAGLPSSPNRIITLFNNNGITYLVKARYDRVSNQIFPPV